MLTEQAAFFSPVDMMIIMAVALVVFGPNKLPEVGRQLGQAMRELKKLTSELTDSIQHESVDIKSAFENSSPYTLKPGPVDAEPHQTALTDGYSKNETDSEKGTNTESGAEVAEAEVPFSGQADAAMIPLTPTVRAKAGDESS